MQARRVCTGKRAREGSAAGGGGSGAGHAAKLARLGGGGTAGKVVIPGPNPGPNPGAQAAWAPSPSRLRGSGSGGALHATQAAAPGLLPGLQARPPHALVMWCMPLRECKAGTAGSASCPGRQRADSFSFQFFGAGKLVACGCLQAQLASAPCLRAFRSYCCARAAALAACMGTLKLGTLIPGCCVCAGRGDARQARAAAAGAGQRRDARQTPRRGRQPRGEGRGSVRGAPRRGQAAGQGLG